MPSTFGWGLAAGSILRQNLAAGLPFTPNLLTFYKLQKSVRFDDILGVMHVCRILLSALLTGFVFSFSSKAQMPDPTQVPTQTPTLSTRPAGVKPLGPPRPPNQNFQYQQLRQLLPSGQGLTVSNLTLKRDAAVFTFVSGAFTLYGEVNGKLTGAVFQGDGTLKLVPPTAEEKRSLSLLTKMPEIEESFQTAVFRFTDDTAAEIRQASMGKAAGSPSSISAGQRLEEALQTKIHQNMDIRLLEDVLSPSTGGFFLASIDGKKYSSKLLFTLDPRGAEGVAPEEVKLETWDENKHGVWTAFHREEEFAAGRPAGNENNGAFAIEHQDLDTTISKGGKIDAIAKITLRAQQDGLAVVPLALFPTLRASSAMGPDGTELDFIQENKERDPDFAVVLAHPLKRGESYVLTIGYSGKDAVEDVGGGNYYPVGSARDRWYPNMPEGGLGGYATYDMTFRVPKGLDVIATGQRTRSVDEGGQTVTHWVTDVPISVAGFNLGRFKKEEATLKTGFVIDAYANMETPDFVEKLKNSGAPMGTMNTTMMLKPELSQGEAAVAIYDDFFGPLPYKNMALTQQTACNYGQSWPMLVYLPICGFWDTTIRHELGLDQLPGNLMYWQVVTPHEVAHQWWGHTVGFRSYRDQWMSEGFADFSASLFLQFTRKDVKDYREFWKEQRRSIIEKNAWGYRPIDVGPVTMGYRLENTRSGENIYRNLVYPKGAYILHMMRMMMWNRQDHDNALKAALHDFVNTNRNRAATTEDFKAALERHLPPALDLDHNGKLDWFFNEYVYGTALPSYSFTFDLQPNDKGTALHFKLTQSHVDSSFEMPVPIYIELNDGNVIRLGAATMAGNTAIEQKAQLPPTASPVKRMMVNYYYDVLSAD